MSSSDVIELNEGLENLRMQEIFKACFSDCSTPEDIVVKAIGYIADIRTCPLVRVTRNQEEYLGAQTDFYLFVHNQLLPVLSNKEQAERVTRALGENFLKVLNSHGDEKIVDYDETLIQLFSRLDINPFLLRFIPKDAQQIISEDSVQISDKETVAMIIDSAFSALRPRFLHFAFSVAGWVQGGRTNIPELLGSSGMQEDFLRLATLAGYYPVENNTFMEWVYEVPIDDDINEDGLLSPFMTFLSELEKDAQSRGIKPVEVESSDW